MSDALEISTDDIFELTINSMGYAADPAELIPLKEFNLCYYPIKENIISRL